MFLQNNSLWKSRHLNRPKSSERLRGAYRAHYTPEVGIRNPESSHHPRVVQMCRVLPAVDTKLPGSTISSLPTVSNQTSAHPRSKHLLCEGSTKYQSGRGHSFTRSHGYENHLETEKHRHPGGGREHTLWGLTRFGKELFSSWFFGFYTIANGVSLKFHFVCCW